MGRSLVFEIRGRGRGRETEDDAQWKTERTLVWEKGWWCDKGAAGTEYFVAVILTNTGVQGTHWGFRDESPWLCR